jgi:hypothetical protein
VISTILSVAAETIVVDRFTDNLSIITVIEHISPESFPIVLPRMFTLFWLKRGPEDTSRPEGIVSITLGNRELLRGPLSIDFQGKLSTRAIMQVQGLVVPSPGVIRSSLSVDGAALGAWEILCEARAAQMTLPSIATPDVETTVTPTTQLDPHRVNNPAGSNTD